MSMSTVSIWSFYLFTISALAYRSILTLIWRKKHMELVHKFIELTDKSPLWSLFSYRIYSFQLAVRIANSLHKEDLGASRSAPSLFTEAHTIATFFQKGIELAIRSLRSLFLLQMWIELAIRSLWSSFLLQKWIVFLTEEQGGCFLK
jgi:hypothetical protein